MQDALQWTVKSNPRSLESRRLRVVVATIVLNVIAVALLALFPGSDWRTGLALNAVDNLILLGFVARNRDLFLGRLVVFGTVVGIVELAADAWLVDVTHTLDYSVGGGPMIWRSPVWMPLAWQVVAVQFGTLGLALLDRLGRWGIVAVALLGAINIPYYEEFAKRIHWWQYHGCRMISNTPYYIIVGEAGIAALLAVLATRLKTGGWVRAMGAGVLGGLGIFLCYVLAYQLTDGRLP